MNIHAKNGNNVSISLSGSEVRTAILAWLVGQGCIIRGDRKTTVLSDPQKEDGITAEVTVSPGGYVFHDGVITKPNMACRLVSFCDMKAFQQSAGADIFLEEQQRFLRYPKAESSAEQEDSDEPTT